jgi:SAM-dependent methyltransferase
MREGIFRSMAKERVVDSTSNRRAWLASLAELADTGQVGRRDREIVEAVVDLLAPESVLQVSYPAGDATAGFTVVGYNANEAHQGREGVARPGHPEGVHFTGALRDHHLSADLTICLDPLAAERGDEAGLARLGQLWETARSGLLVSVVDGSAEPDGVGERSAWLREALRQVIPEIEVYPAFGERRSFLLALRPPLGRHPRDFTPATLDPLVDRHPDPLALAAVRVVAWRTLGFYPDHAPRLWEYPVVIRLLTDALPPGGSIVDVGAGTTPLAPFLTGLGYRVDTVDPSDELRGWPPADDWNEWGYLDYAAVGLARHSWNLTLDGLPTLRPFDGLCSVSVIEHVPGDVRRDLLREFARRVRPGGIVVLTVDLVRGCDDLWNRNLGVEVEDPKAHGTLSDIVDEAAREGLELVSQETVRYWGETSVDIALIALRRSPRPLGITDRPLATARSEPSASRRRLPSLIRRLTGS